jgi:hypothetical protein
MGVVSSRILFLMLRFKIFSLVTLSSPPLCSDIQTFNLTDCSDQFVTVTAVLTYAYVARNRRMGKGIDVVKVWGINKYWKYWKC